MDTDIKYITLAQAADIAHVDASTLRRAIAKEDLTAVKMGKTWLTDREAVEIWLQTAKHKPGKAARK